MNSKQVWFWILEILPDLNLAIKDDIKPVSFGTFGKEDVPRMKVFFMTDRKDKLDLTGVQVFEEEDVLQELEMVHGVLQKKGLPEEA